MLLLALAVWNLVRTYREGVSEVAEEAGKAVQRAVLAAENARGLAREARGFDAQAMQMAAAAVHGDGEGPSAVISTAREVKGEVEGMAVDLAAAEEGVRKVRNLAERARVLAEEGDLAFATTVVVKVGKAAERVIEVEKRLKEKAEGMRQKLWDLSAEDRDGSGSRIEVCQSR